MRRASICLASTLLATAITSGCSTATKNSDSSAPPPTAQSAAEAIKAAIPEITALVPVTESNDANNMIGRSNGYVALTVLVDPRTGEHCDLTKPGIACGAGIEQWPNAAAAEKRDFINKSVLSSAPILNTEYSVLKNNLLLRIDGKLKPSEADAYKKAFLG